MRHLTLALTPAVAAIVCAFVPPAAATDRYFGDTSATSPSGRWRIDAKSPENAGPEPRPFAENFTYTLTDLRTNQVRWTRRQPMEQPEGGTSSWSHEPSPIAVDAPRAQARPSSPFSLPAA